MSSFWAQNWAEDAPKQWEYKTKSRNTDFEEIEKIWRKDYSLSLFFYSPDHLTCSGSSKTTDSKCSSAVCLQITQGDEKTQWSSRRDKQWDKWPVSLTECKRRNGKENKAGGSRWVNQQARKRKQKYRAKYTRMGE